MNDADSDSLSQSFSFCSPPLPSTRYDTKVRLTMRNLSMSLLFVILPFSSLTFCKTLSCNCSKPPAAAASSVARPHRQQHIIMDKENRTHRPQTPVKILPPGSSKVLRKHLSSQQRQRKHLQSGPIRVTTTTTPSGRMGYDGTYETPSKELLKSTSCSRRQRIRPVEDSPLNIVLQQPQVGLGGERQDCINPVAWTLWNAGDEEPLYEHQRDSSCSPAAVHTQPPACVARPLPTRPRQQQQQNAMMMLS